MIKKMLRKATNRAKHYFGAIYLLVYLFFPLGKKIYIIGSPTYTNIGDSAILLAERGFVRKAGIHRNRIKEITFREYYQHRRVVRKGVSSHQLILGLGGGNMGNQWKREEKFRYDLLKDFPENQVIIFPQTIHFIDIPSREEDERKSQRAYDGRKGLTIIAREKQSEQIMKSMYPHTRVMLCPDIVLHGTMEDFGIKPGKRRGVLMCIRKDEEKKVNDSIWREIQDHLEGIGKKTKKIDMYSDGHVSKQNRKRRVETKMKDFANAELVITDRLHAMIFSAITSTPCIVFSNNNHKILGTYDWISYLPYIQYVETAKEAIHFVPELLNMQDCEYNNRPLMPYYEAVENHMLNLYGKA